MLFEPLKSADPPINSGKFSVIFSKTKAEDFLDACEVFKSKIFFFIDIICSSIKRNKELPSREVIKKHIKVLEKYGFDDFVKLETFMTIKIPKNFRFYIVNKFSINKVKEEIKKFNNFQEFDPSTKFH